MAKKRAGRKKGGSNRGYFFRAKRGWYAYQDGTQIPLRGENGRHIKNPDAKTKEVRDAYVRWYDQKQKGIHQTNPDDHITVLDICLKYLAHVKMHGSPKTHADRADTLFDFCFGLPSEQRNKVGSAPFRDLGNDGSKPLTTTQKQNLTRLKIHDGLGSLPISELKKHHITKWLDAHGTWTASR